MTLRAVGWSMCLKYAQRRARRVTTALVFPRATADLVRRHVTGHMTVLAVDAGADACLAAGVVPALVVGDMDSAAPGTLDALAAKGARIDRHPAAKRDTDGALALSHVRDADVLFVGAFGGRADHALANLHLLVRASARAVDEDAWTWCATPERPLALDRPAGTTLTVLPFGGRAEGVTLDGFRWPLRDATMETGDPYGVSNEALAPPQRVSVRHGTLVVIEPRQTL